jgi:hypothetical protein
VRSFVGRVSFAAVTAAFALGVVPGSVLATAPVSTFNVTIGQSCLTGLGQPATPLTIRLRSASGDMLGTRQVTTDGGGHWNACFWNDPRVSDRVSATDGVTTAVLTIPSVTLSVNRVTDVFSGSAPANSTVNLSEVPCQSFDACAAPVNHSVATSSAGAFSYDFTPLANVRGNDNAYAIWTSPNGDHVTAYRRVPELWIWYRYNHFGGSANSGALVTLKLRNAGGTLLATGHDYASYYGSFGDVALRDSSGNPINFVAGDKVKASIASDAAFTVKNMNIVANAVADTVSASCFPNAPYDVYAEHPDNSGSPSWNEVYGTANSSGNFTADMTAGLQPGYDLISGDDLDVECRTAKGDEEFWQGEVP